MGRQAACGVANWLTWKACDPSRIFFAMTVWYSGAHSWGLWPPPILLQFFARFSDCLVAAIGLYLIAGLIDLVNCLDSCFIYRKELFL
nr:MAG TPA: hypothetical protein [Caudoviricetes sp.]